jgi:hypothetical protein
METRTTLLEKAARFRRLASAITDDESKRALRAAADKFEAQARETELSARRNRCADRPEPESDSRGVERARL